MPEGNAERSVFLFLLLSISRSFQNNFVLETGPVSGGAWRLLCSWDFSVVNEKAIQYNKNNLGIQLKVHTCLYSSRCHAFSVSIGSFCPCLPGVLIRKVTGEKQNVSVWQNKASVSPPTGLAALFRTRPRLWCRHILPGDRTAGKFIHSVVISQKNTHVCITLMCLCFAADLQFRSWSKWFKGRGIYSASACGCGAHQPDSASPLLPYQQNGELLQSTCTDLHQHREVWSLVLYQKHPIFIANNGRWPHLYCLLFLETLFWRCPFLEFFAFTGWMTFPTKSQ